MARYGLFATLVILPLAATLCYGQYTFVGSRATYYRSHDSPGTPSGACGFGEYGRTVNNGEVTGVSRLYRNGTGCGACHQVRCKIPGHRSEEGTTVVVTDYGEGHYTNFVLSARAYAKLAKPDKAKELFAYGVVEIEYKRVPCCYGYNLLLKVHEHSKYPLYLAIVPLYKEGIYDITVVEVWQEDCKEWKPMCRAYGIVFDTQSPPKGSLNFRLQLSAEGSAEVKRVQIASAIPAEWKVGVSYDQCF